MPTQTRSPANAAIISARIKMNVFKSSELVVIDCNVPLKMDYDAFAVKAL